MLTWLVLLALIGFAVHLNSRLRRLEERFENQPATAYGSPAWSEPTAPEPIERPAPISTPEAAEPAEAPRTAVVLYGDTRSAESTPVEFAGEEAEPESPRWNVGIGFEELFGRRLPIWAGGITLAVAGMLIVKLSIESGLLTPLFRVVSGLTFGAVLIAAAELALRFEERVRDPRVRQALAGAGVASLYASIIVAVNLYHLVGPLTAMLGMAGVTALAMFLSTRFGPPSALLGLAGGLAAPAFVGSAAPNVPLLSLYLALAVSGLCALSRSQRWAWLGISALVGGFGWGIVLLLGGILDAPSSISLGLYLLLLGVGIPALGFAGDRKDQLQLIAGIAAAAQMAALVATGGFALVNWGLFALLSIASVWLAQRNAQLARLPAVGLVVALLLMGAWTSPAVNDLALVMSGFALIYGATAVWRLWRADGLIEAAEIGALALAGLLLPMFHFFRADGSRDLVFGLLAIGLSLAVGACVALGWRNADRRSDARFALLAIVTGVLLAGAALLLLPVWTAALAISLIGLVLLHLGQLAEDPRLEPFAWIFAAAGVLTYPYSQAIDGTSFSDSVDALHWSGQAGIAALFAWRARFSAGRKVAELIVPAFFYIAFASLMPERIEPLIAPVLLVGTAAATRLLRRELMPAMTSCLAIIVAWAVSPLLLWSTGAVESLTGSLMLVTGVPVMVDAITRLAAPGLLIGAAALIAGVRLRPWIGSWSIASVLAVVAAHSLYKHLFALATPQAFVSLGLAERTVWEIALAALALIALRLRSPVVALALVAAAAAHETLYSLLLHNPLWSAQAVGAWPVVNLILPVYALAISA